MPLDGSGRLPVVLLISSYYYSPFHGFTKMWVNFWHCNTRNSFQFSWGMSIIALSINHFANIIRTQSGPFRLWLGCWSTKSKIHVYMWRALSIKAEVLVRFHFLFNPKLWNWLLFFPNFVPRFDDETFLSKTEKRITLHSSLPLYWGEINNLPADHKRWQNGLYLISFTCT